MTSLIKNVRLLDISYCYDALDVLVQDGVIRAVGTDLIAADAQVIDLSGRTLMPAFSDAHVHVKPSKGSFSDEIISAMAKNGLSCVKDLGILDDIPLEGYLEWLRQQDVPGKVRVATAGRYIDVDGGYGMGPMPDAKWGIEIITPEEAADAVAYQYRAGVNGIKIGINDGGMSPRKGVLSGAHVKAITDRAHRLGIWTTAHVYTVEDLRMLVENGIDEAAHTPHDALMDDELIAEMVDKNISMTTTIGNRTENDPLPEHFPPTFSSAKEFQDKMLANQDMTLQNLKKFYKAGGRICVGTDFMRSEDPEREATIPVAELKHLHQAVGMNMQETVAAGTVNAAYSCGFCDEGAIRPGCRANLIAFSGELDKDFHKLLALEFVMNRGVILRDER